MFMEIAHVVAKRATCFRLNVGALVVYNNRIIGMGYNGQEPGKPHCTKMCEPGECITTHAERNALRYAPATRGLVDLYCTDAPCAHCASFITENSNPPIARVFFDRPYRDDTGLKIMQESGIHVFRVLHAGIIDWKTQKQVADF